MDLKCIYMFINYYQYKNFWLEDNLTRKTKDDERQSYELNDFNYV